MRAPSVSIIIPCFNAAKWLAETLDSAFAQSWPNKEIILVNDGSTDGSLAVAERYLDRGLRVIDRPNAGASAARNAGIRAATGDYLQFLDADDLLGSDKIERQIETLRASPPDAVASAEWARFRVDPREAVFRPQPPWRDFDDPAKFVQMHFDTGFMMQPAVWLVPRAVADRAGPWDERLSLNDDGEYFCRVLLASSKVVFSEGARVYYRSALATSLSARRDLAALRSYILSIDLKTNALLARSDTPEVRASVANVFQHLAYSVYPDLPDESRAAEAKARAYGGAQRPWQVGPRLRLVSKVLGWRPAARLKRWTNA